MTILCGREHAWRRTAGGLRAHHRPELFLFPVQRRRWRTRDLDRYQPLLRGEPLYWWDRVVAGTLYSVPYGWRGRVLRRPPPRAKRRHDCRRGTRGGVRHKGILANSLRLATSSWIKSDF